MLTARDWPYPAHTVFNAGACQVGEETVLLVRVEDRRGHSHLTVARSHDGLSNWHVDPKPSFGNVHLWDVADGKLQPTLKLIFDSLLSFLMFTMRFSRGF
jgi:predicted GH43/DUF377 family glycosyl hydrolase